jgi:hypothetical protein
MLVINSNFVSELLYGVILGFSKSPAVRPDISSETSKLFTLNLLLFVLIVFIVINSVVRLLRFAFAGPAPNGKLIPSVGHLYIL